MKQKPLLLAVATAGLIAAAPTYAHVANVDMSSTSPSMSGDAPDYLIYTPSAVTANGATTYTLKASTINPIPAGFTGDPSCPYGGNMLDTTTTPPTEVLDPVTGLPIPCNYQAAGIDGFLAGGWAQGTTINLGDSHALHGGVFFTFTLTKKSTVTISFGNDPAYVPPDGLPNALNAAFSLYEHVLPTDGHDDNPFDPLQPTGADGYYTASATDKVPLVDPGVAEYLWDPNTGTASPNPAYTSRIAREYKLFYPASGPYRDTQNYTATGGLDANGIAIGPTAGQSPYLGQFNAKGNWSLANADADPADPANDPIRGANLRLQTTFNIGNGKIAVPDGTRQVIDPATGDILWSEIRFLAAVNSRTGKNAGQAETLTATLQPGSYTIAAGDAGAASGRILGGVLSVKIK